MQFACNSTKLNSTTFRIGSKINNGGGKKKNEKKYTMYPERYELDLSQYKKDLWTCFKNILIAYGFTNEELTQLTSQFNN
jgi:hypothetical protein